MCVTSGTQNCSVASTFDRISLPLQSKPDSPYQMWLVLLKCSLGVLLFDIVQLLVSDLWPLRSCGLHLVCVQPQALKWRSEQRTAHRSAGLTVSGFCWYGVVFLCVCVCVCACKHTCVLQWNALEFFWVLDLLLTPKRGREIIYGAESIKHVAVTSP